MTLENLSTPFERRRVIEYGKDGIKAVRHWYEVQRVEGPLYKERERESNRQGEMEFNLFLFFPNVPDGILYARGIRNPERYSVKQVMENLAKTGNDTLEHLVASLDARASQGRFIGNADIEFIRQFDPERADRYAQYRLDCYARHEEEQRKDRMERQKKEAEEKAARQAELVEKRAKYLGWADDMTPMRFGQISAFLEKRVRVDGAVMTKREFIISSVKNGWMPINSKKQSSTVEANEAPEAVSLEWSIGCTKIAVPAKLPKRSTSLQYIWRRRTACEQGPCAAHIRQNHPSCFGMGDDFI